MSLSDSQCAFVFDIARLIAYCEAEGLKMTPGEAYRTQEQQDLHIAAGRSWKKHSKHQDGLAEDFNFFLEKEVIPELLQDPGYKPVLVYVGILPDEEVKKRLQHVGDYWCSLNPKNRWGGNYSLKCLDVPHFERLR